MVRRKQDKRHGPTFNPAGGAATAGGPQHPAESTPTTSNLEKLLAKLQTPRPNINSGIKHERPLAEYRHRKPVRHGKP